jgi:hypothetical protein
MAKIHPNNPTLRNPAFAKKVFQAAHQPRAWYAVARRLRSSAQAIFERENPVAQRHYDELQRLGTLAAGGDTTDEYDEIKYPFPNFDAAHMLIAFAIENLLKGLMVAKGIATFSKQELPKILNTHNLAKLHQLAAPRAVVPMYALDMLSYMAEWRGRYPLPITADGFWPMDDHGVPRVSGYSWPQFQTDFLTYCDSLEAELRALVVELDQPPASNSP